MNGIEDRAGHIERLPCRENEKRSGTPAPVGAAERVKLLERGDDRKPLEQLGMTVTTVLNKHQSIKRLSSLKKKVGSAESAREYAYRTCAAIGY
jgi:hypothetical protein